MLRAVLFVLTVACMASTRVGLCAEGTIVQVETIALKAANHHIFVSRIYVQSGEDVWLCRVEETAAEPSYKVGDRFSFPPQQCELPEVVTFVGMIGAPPDYARVVVRRVGGTQWRCRVPSGLNTEMEVGEELLLYPSYFGYECTAEKPPEQPEKK